MNNTTSVLVDHIDDQLNPHWVITVFSVIGYSVCTLMGSASSITSLCRMISQKKLRRSYWSTILLLAASVFVSLIVVPLEVTQMTLHYFNTSTYMLCDAHFFSMAISQMLAFMCTITIAVSRVRKMHSKFQANVQDLAERIAVILSWVICFPIAGTLSYGFHTQKCITIPYQYCLKLKDILVEDTQTPCQTSLNSILPTMFLTILACLISVYMKGVLHIKKQMSIGVSYPNMTLENMQIKTISDSNISKSLRSLSVRTENHTDLPCSEITADTGAAKSDGELSYQQKMSTTARWNGKKNTLFLVPRESMSSTEYLTCNSSLSSTYSPSPQAGGFQQFSQTDLSPRSNFASIETTSDTSPSKAPMRKVRKTQSRISKALKKVSTVSMLSIDNIPESPEVTPQLLQPLRHIRHSASNIWHQGNGNALEQKFHRSGNTIKGKMKTISLQNSRDSTASSSSSPSPMISDIDGQSDQNAYPTKQRFKRQNSHCSITLNATHSSNFTADDGDLQNTVPIMFDSPSADTHAIFELVDKSDNKAAEIKELCSVSVTSFPTQQGQEESFGSEELGEDDRNCDNLSAVDSFRRPLPPINSNHQDNEHSHIHHKSVDIRHQITMSDVIHTRRKSQYKNKMFRRSQSLNNFNANSPPVSSLKRYEVEIPQKSQPIAKTLVDQMTQTEQLTERNEEKYDEIDDVMPEQSLESTSSQNMQQQQRPMIRIIRPSLPHRAEPSGINTSRRVLMNNWCPPDLKRSPSVQFMEPTGTSGSFDRHYNDVHRGSIWSSRSAFLMNRYEMDVKRVFKRSCLLISAYMVCFLPTTILYLAHLLHEHAMVNLYTFSRVLECSYFTAVPFLYVYTNASLMKLIHKKRK